MTKKSENIIVNENALNAAVYEFIHSYEGLTKQRIPRPIYDHCEYVLRCAIKAYIENVKRENKRKYVIWLYEMDEDK